MLETIPERSSNSMEKENEKDDADGPNRSDSSNCPNNSTITLAPPLAKIIEENGSAELNKSETKHVKWLNPENQLKM